MEIINQALKVFQENNYVSLFSVVKRKNFFFDEESKMVMKFLGDKKYLPTLETKFISPSYEAVHCIYLWKAEREKTEGIRWSQAELYAEFYDHEQIRNYIQTGGLFQ